MHDCGNPLHRHGLDRRGFLAGGVAIFGGLYLGMDRARAASLGALNAGVDLDDAPRTLLLLELSGGNDGLSTIVPYADDAYYRARERTAIERTKLLALDDYRGFHPALAGMSALHHEGKLAIVEGIGYPNPNLSHFTSQDIWHTARPTGRASGEGWIGRLMRELYPQDTAVPHAIHVGPTLPYALTSSTHAVSCFDAAVAYRWAGDGPAVAEIGGREPAGNDPASKIRRVVRTAATSSSDVRRVVGDYKPRVQYPNSDLAQDLKTAAALLQGRIGARVLSVTQGGYDTHEDQRRRHDMLVADLDAALSAFLKDVRGTPAGDKLVVVVFSEFGRRVADNASLGTDHGTAGPMFVTGTPVKGGLYGKHASLTELHDGDLVHTTDFRSVYATALDRWLNVPSERVLGAKYAPIECLA